MNTPTVLRRLAPLLPLLALAIEARGDSLNGLRSAVARVGDVNGDGVPDVAVASRDRNRPERVWILSGKDGTRLLEISGRTPGDRFGSEIGAVGDWNRDGVPDLSVVARKERSQDRSVGYCRVISGRTGEVLLESPGAGPIGGTHDLDRDGHLDLLIVLQDSSDGTMAVCVLSGSDGSILLRGSSSSAGRVDGGPVVESITWLGDGDGDGRYDYATARSRSVQGARNGPVRLSYEFALCSGNDGRILWCAPLEPHSIPDTGLVAPLQDVNADGVAELLCGLEDQRVRLRDGKSGSTIWRRESRTDASYSLGSSLDRLGDIDRDGVEDWVIAANESWGDFFDAGLCSVHSGKTGESLLALREDDNFGFDACGIGDVNADGVPDFAVGAERQRGWTPDDSSEPAVQVRSGKDASILWMRRHADLRH